ncbi:glycosyltransferase WbuB [Variovorax sp. PAMC 28711]|uniref:glycosyltransferase WbuB n=1 Tax=Variovorax sp. PAMC 28711 TaxID=1795631 RepID=UPI00078BB999|nr:glycosyltransferase WbuB [Variovorax sp. PAMC 28711]AMM25516.1 glycosyltransferase WbuB [Variovorax sp. PAMC 28711]
MKILLYGINFTPELTGIGKYTGEMARWLAKAGHEVRVITAPPYYPNWSVQPPFRADRYTRETWEGVEVYRAPLWVPAVPSGLKRLVHLASFAASSFPLLVAQWRWKPDVVWVTEPPLLCTPGALLFAKLRQTIAWLHVQDYELDAAFDLGLLRGETTRSVATAMERRLMRAFDCVSTISGRMLDRARSKGVDEANLFLLPNWVDLNGVRPLAQPSAYRQKLGIPLDATVALYSGNMGNKQGLEILSDVARRVHDRPDIHFVFCGDGSGRAELVAQCAGLDRVHFLPLQPLENLSDLLGLADVHLLPQRADAADLVMPSKLTGMLSSGRPVIATAHPGTELASVVEQCGIVVAPADAAALTTALLTLAADAPLRSELGTKARHYAEQHLGQDAVLRRFELELEKRVAARRGEVAAT